MVKRPAPSCIKELSFLCLLCVLFCAACTKRGPAPEISFYYWKTSLRLGAGEKECLEHNKVQRLYLRYFDVEYSALLKDATPVSALHFRDSLPVAGIPVIYVKNAVFEHMKDSLDLAILAERVLHLCEQINTTGKLRPAELQIDCDWTSGTATAYFAWLRQVRAVLTDKRAEYPSFSGPNTLLSATIRLHQIKYPQQTGIPPVDKGVLMYYNMGKISNSDQNSIYDPAVSRKYLASLSVYPLPLDIALPVFAWGIQLRDTKVLTLLNGMDERDMEQDTGFTALGAHRYRARVSFFRNGFYLRQGDEVKIEETNRSMLLKMARDIRSRYDKHVQRIIFYALDTHNLSRYDPEIFKKIAGRFN